jgi:uncharacterized protein YegP (UPF0339 family)
MKNVLNLFRDRRHEWRWTAVAGENGKILADSGEGYTNKDDAVAGFVRLATMGQGVVEVRTAGDDGIEVEQWDFGFSPYLIMKHWLETWNIGFSEYTEDDESKSLVLEDGDKYWILSFNTDGSFRQSVGQADLPS